MKKVILCLMLCLLPTLCFADAKSVTVETTSTTVVTADTDRTSLLIKNTSSTTCYLTNETAATTDDFELAEDEVYIANGKHAARAVNAITSSGSAEVDVWEGES